jgi:hypothetical protein
MHAVFVEVDADESHVDAARQALNQNVAPAAREAGARAGYWLSPQGGRGVGVVVFETEEGARAMAGQLKVGEPPPDAPPGVIVRTVEVREVLASL